jgi:hypothetical protein
MNIDRWFMPYLCPSSCPIPNQNTIKVEPKPQTIVGQATHLVRTVSRLALDCLTGSVAACSLESSTPSPQTSPKEQNRQEGYALSPRQISIQASCTDEKSEEKEAKLDKPNSVSLVYQEVLGETFSFNNALYAKVLKEMYKRKKCLDCQDLPQTLAAQFCQSSQTITELDLRDLSLSSQDLDFLVTAFVGLEKLSFSAEQFSDQHITLLASRPSLSILKLYEAKKFDISHFKALMKLKQLERITLQKSLLSNRDYGYLLPTEEACKTIKKVLKEHDTLLFVSCDDIDFKHPNADENMDYR